MAVADFNGDGRPDLAVGIASGEAARPVSAGVLLGSRDGGFPVSRTLFESRSSTSVAVGDFNGDGQPDLAVAATGAPGEDGYVGVALGNGDGTFRGAREFGGVENPWYVAIGDFNGDGRTDLVVTNALSVSVLLGNGDGTFQPARTVFAANNLAPPAVADLNGDGKADIVVASETSNDVSILLAKGDGTVQSVQTLAVGKRPVSVAVGDFNADGKPDLAVANAGSESVSVLLGRGDGTFESAQTFEVGNSPFSVAVGDFDGDGKPDLAVANADSNTISILLGRGDGTFEQQQSFPAGQLPEALAVADFDADGTPDIAVGGAGSVWLLRNVVNAPAVTTGLADGVTETGATLHGTVNPLDADLAGRWYFQYGTARAYGFATAMINIPAGATSTAVARAISDLKPSTTYHYRLVATNAGGTSYGADRTFKTAARLSSLRLIPSRFRASRSGPSIVTHKAVGTTVLFKLSGSATITFRVQKVRVGRRQGKVCRPDTRTRRRLRRCIRYLPLTGSFKYVGKSGKNHFTFTGRLQHTLKPGRYVLIATAHGRTGQSSTPVRATFTIRRQLGA